MCAMNEMEAVGGRIMRDAQSGSLGVKTFFGFKELIFALFLTAGNFKADPRLEWLPVDFTLLMALATVVFVIKEFLKSGLRVPTSLPLLLGFFLLFLPSTLWTDWHSYAIVKTVRFFTLTLLATVAPLFLIRSRRDLRRFLAALALLGGVMAADALLFLLAGGEQLHRSLAARLMIFSSSTITLGRAAGISFLWMALLRPRGWAMSLLAFSSIGVLAIVILGAGSRGPLLATAAALFVTVVLFQWRKPSSIVRFAAVVIVGALGVMWAYPMLPGGSLLRAERFFSGEFGSSELLRVQAYRVSWETIRENPLGIGLGGFAKRSDLWLGEARQFPHNILLETLLEGGWLAGIYFAFLLVRACQNVKCFTRKLTGVTEFRTLFAVLLFLLMNDMVSGELNDSKMLLAFVGLALGLREDTNDEGQEYSKHL